ncbi:hypothetical protein O181_033840 [Austropuccinia psidii MF-1]|uniref:Integrase catalytic domain-containing protein n=1 Tax=Austropuccinia psidii MF-1 TaxID=1389203 RepID=A0A9Q3H9L6_9BASI|nr:hypothetical protein [Austropuccinia psidii MF-1]
METFIQLMWKATFVGVGVWNVSSAITRAGARLAWDKSLTETNLLEDLNDLISTNDSNLFPTIQPPSPTHIRTRTEIYGWLLESLSPTMTQITLITLVQSTFQKDQQDSLGWSSKSWTPAQLIAQVASVGKFTIKYSGPPIITRIWGARVIFSQYEYEKGTFRAKYTLSEKSLTPAFEEPFGSNTSFLDPSKTSLVKCELRCDCNTWASSLHIFVDPPLIKATCLRCHKLSSGGGWLDQYSLFVPCLWKSSPNGSATCTQSVSLVGKRHEEQHSTEPTCVEPLLSKKPIIPTSTKQAKTSHLSIPMSSALEALSRLKSFYIEQGPDFITPPAGWTLVAEKGTSSVYKKIVSQISSVFPFYCTDQVILNPVVYFLKSTPCYLVNCTLSCYPPLVLISNRFTVSNMTDLLNNPKEESGIPVLDGSNYGEWHHRMRFLLRSKELLEVCEKPLSPDASPSATNRWNKLSFEAITLITSKLNRRVFLAVVNPETSEKSNALWAKINLEYASKRTMNKGRVWLDWQKVPYTGDLQGYIDDTRKFLFELESVSVKIPSEILSYIILGKLGNDPSLTQIIELLTLNDTLIEQPREILSRLQEYTRLQHTQTDENVTNATALISTTDHPYRITYYCTNGKHNIKCISHKKEECFAENPHLRPQKRNIKRKFHNMNASAHYSKAQALITTKHSSPNKTQAVIDCGATHHMFGIKNLFTSFSPVSRFSIATGDPSSNLIAEGVGNVTILSNGNTLNLSNCLFVPKLSCNLISLLQLFNSKLTINRQDSVFQLVSSGTTLLQGYVENNLMKINLEIPSSFVTTSADDMWHKRLGHPGRLPVRNMGLPSNHAPCITCDLNKAHSLPFKHQFEPVSSPLDCVHIDIVGPITPSSISGYRYFLTIVDQATSFKMTFLLKNKSDAFNQFVVAKRQFKKLADLHGLVHIFSPAYTPEHNGFAERANRTILEKTRCLLNGSNLPNSYWAEALSTATHLSNLIPTPSRHNKSPYALWTKMHPRIKKLRVFGCLAILIIPKNLRNWKLSQTGREGILLGYENDMSAYRVLRIHDREVIVSRHVIFNESVFPSLQGKPKNYTQLKVPGILRTLDSENETCPSTGAQLGEEHQAMVDETHHSSEEPSPSEVVDEVQPADGAESYPNNHRRTIKIIGPRHPTLITSNIDPTNILPYARRIEAHLTLMNDTPRTFNSALKSPASDMWREAIHKELQSMEELKVWEPVELDPAYKIVGTTWVFKLKKDKHGGILEHKARLCAQGFSQTPGVDYDKTYAPTGRLNSLRTLIAFAASSGLEFHQVDIRSAFLNAPLSETVFLSVPQGLPYDRRKYCLRLKKAIYGLKQAPLAWYERLKHWLGKIGFKACVIDPCVFYRPAQPPTWLYVHVDDIAIFSKNICHSEASLSLDQQHFTESLLHLYGMANCRPVLTPLPPNEYLQSPTTEEVAKFGSLHVNYRSAIGSINYLSTATRPDLAFAVSSLSQFLERPGIRHWKAFLHVLQYLQGTQNLGLVYRKGGGVQISAYSDADWGNCKDTRRSISGFLATLNECLVLWETWKQPSVSLSSAEAEYKSLCDLTSELLWLRKWCIECSISKVDYAIPIHEDNQGCISTACGNSSINNKRMKHVDIQLHFVKEAVNSSKICLRYTPTKLMLADFLTKSVNGATLSAALRSLRVQRLEVRGDVEKEGLAPNKDPPPTLLGAEPELP